MDVAKSSELALAKPVVGDQQDKPSSPRREAETMEFTKARLDELLKTGRPQRQKMIWDTTERGLSVLISRGPKHRRQATVTFRVVYYLKDNPGKPRYQRLGSYPDDYPNFDIQAVRDDARLIRINAKKHGIDPRKPKLTGDVAGIIKQFIDDYAKPSTKTWAETERMFNRYVLPEWGERKIETITKTDVNDLLDKIARKGIEYVDEGTDKRRGTGKRRKAGTKAVAVAVRAQLGVLFNWYVDEYGSDAFRSPIVKTHRTKQWKPKPRERVLSDDEIRALWTACGEMDAYGAVVKTALLTAQRFRKVGKMRRDPKELKEHYVIPSHTDPESGEFIPEKDIGHVWDPTSPDDPKNKGVSPVPLPTLARKIIDAQPIIDAPKAKAKDFVFSTNGTTAIGGWSKYKARLDAKMLALLRQWAQQRGHDPDLVILKPWQQRDLRRTARTLMPRAGVDRDVAEHCLAHKPPGVEGVYDRYAYLPEKREAFRALAEWIEKRILDHRPQGGGNVVALAGAASKRRKATRRIERTPA